MTATTGARGWDRVRPGRRRTRGRNIIGEGGDAADNAAPREEAT